jgi:hypothetical protein
MDDEKCPYCGLELQVDEEEEMATNDPLAVEAQESDSSINPENLKRDRVLFYSGVLLIIAGGPGMAFASWLHDLLRVPIVGESFQAFGWINIIVAVAGFIVLFLGIVFLVLSLRGGILPQIPEEDIAVKAEG